MTPRTAILRAADSIERNPAEFKFSSIETPGCGTPGCALGWIAFHWGTHHTHWHQDEEFMLTFVGSMDMYDCEYFYEALKNIEEFWMTQPKSCARALRVYADQKYPNRGLPVIVQEIVDARYEVNEELNHWAAHEEACHG